AVAPAGARAALDDWHPWRWSLDHTARARGRLHDGLIALGARPFPSVANFVTAAIDRPPAEVVAALATRGILISRLMQPGYENYLRITVGTADDTDAVLAALTEILAPPTVS
ncbi:MAG: aminotransferase class I/II-fold pyridoxal phosphate-dependent enzyme, partial [Pseudomonadota bacterium]|nr:aminotransferase class I/II-fold pyridoxal phosphate-dependent enzyme [Pseudomonadota bacterium]